MRTTTEVLESHLANRLSGDLDKDLAENYAEDVILLTGTGALKGHKGVRQSSRELGEYTQGAKFTYNHTLVEGKYAFLEWTAAASDKAVFDGADSFVIENGKITFQSIHYSVNTQQPKGRQ
jgi:hypothetical protein